MDDLDTSRPHAAGTSHRIGCQANLPGEVEAGGHTDWSKKRANLFTSSRGNCLQAHIVMLAFVATLIGAEKLLLVAAFICRTAFG